MRENDIFLYGRSDTQVKRLYIVIVCYAILIFIKLHTQKICIMRP